MFLAQHHHGSGQQMHVDSRDEVAGSQGYHWPLQQETGRKHISQPIRLRSADCVPAHIQLLPLQLRLATAHIPR